MPELFMPELFNDFVQGGEQDWIALLLKTKILEQPLIQVEQECLILIIKIGALKNLIG